MALLHKYKKYICAVCHVNYNKRKTAARDQKIVEQYCKKNKIRLFIKNVNQKDYEKTNSNNFQTSARLIRYDFFQSISKKLRNNNLLVAHNLDDFIETAYMQLKRNSNKLFYGIQRKSKYKNLLIYRPLINIRKKELQHYCLMHNIPFGIDETNFSNVYERNLVRKEISHWSNNKFVSFKNKIDKLNKKNSRILKEVNDTFTKWVKSVYSVEFFKKISNKIKPYLIYELLSSVDVHKTSKDKINNIIKFINSSNSHSKYRIGNNKHLIKNKNNISIY